MKNKLALAAIAAMMTGNIGGWGTSPGKSGEEKPNSNRIKNLSDTDLEWYRDLPKSERATAMRVLRAKYMWGV